MDTEAEKFYVQEAMLAYGGGFIKGLGEALSHADPVNVEKIKANWPGYWKEYYEMGTHMESGKNDN